MPTERWFPLLAVILIVGLMLRSPFLVALPTAIAVILTLASWWKKQSLENVNYRRRFHYTRAFPGESFPVRLEIENRKFLPLSWLRIQDPWPKAIGPQDEEVLAPSHGTDQGVLTHIFSLRWFERVQRSYPLLFRKRGVYAVGPAQLESGDLFGIYETSRSTGKPEYITVFPALVPLPELDLPPEDPYGELRSRRRLFEDPNRPMGIREYHPEDGFRRMHWPATARTGELQVKIYQPTSAQVMMLCLNISTYHRYWEGVYPELLEYLVSVTATLAQRGLEQGYRVGLISNGSLSNSDQPFRIQPGRSPQQLSHLLEALAGVTPLVSAPFERFLMREVSRVLYGATLMIVTAWTNPELAETLVRLKRHERRIILLSVSEAAPREIPGVRCIHVPFRENGKNG
jgi:uncharacterized protein (DUF58 family)